MGHEVHRKMRFAGVTLANFRKLDKKGRLLLWMYVTANKEWAC